LNKVLFKFILACLKPEKIKIYCDFDGTITLNDVWIEMGNVFITDKSAWNDVIYRFESGQIGARVCFSAECSLIKNFNIEKFNEIIDRQEIDPYFKEFYSYCNENHIKLIILSEGLDYYIKRVLSNHSLNIPFYSNKLLISDDGKSISLDFPYSDSDCIRCGVSKRNILMNQTADDEISVFIGDGFSDTCAVHYADIVFAKGALASYCWKNNITYFDYRNFLDVLKKIHKLLNLRTIKQRQTARINRRNVYMRG